MIKLETTLESNIDLTQFSNRRLLINKIGKNLFSFESTFKMWDCAARRFAYEYAKNMAKDKGLEVKYYCGNASAPCGIEF